MTKMPHILIVEDDEWLAEQYVRTFNSGSMKAESVHNALAAMDAIELRVPDILVLDLLLVGPNAFTLLHELQSHVDLASIPVIICTNSADQLIDEDLKMYGVVQVLDKALIKPDDLVAAVRRALL